MRLEIACQNRLGMAQALLGRCSEQQIDIKGIELTSSGKLYLNLPALPFEQFSELMRQIRQTEGVYDAKTVDFTPFERQYQALQTLLTSLNESIIFASSSAEIEWVNQAASAFFDKTTTELYQINLASLLPTFSFSRIVEQFIFAEPAALMVPLTIKKQLINIQVLPIWQQEEPRTLIGVVLRLFTQENHLGKSQGHFTDWIANSPAMKTVLEQAITFAPMDAPLLITGETGTGKELLAHQCHQYSLRRQRPFLALNCAGLPEDVAESELFGHAAGVYNVITAQKGFFEQADGGTVLLDEVAELSLALQAKLLRFLVDGRFRQVGEEQEIQVDVRIICTSQTDLLAKVAVGAFREDLYYRLQVLNLNLPPLRQRQQDILPLANYFLQQFAKERRLSSSTPMQLSEDLLDYLQHYPWPGNVRQLKNVLYQASLINNTTLLTVADIDLPLIVPQTMDDEMLLEGSLDDICKRFERQVLTQLYHQYPSTRKLAQRLAVSHTAIANKLREYGLGKK